MHRSPISFGPFLLREWIVRKRRVETPNRSEIEAYGRGQRESRLTWKALEEFSGFSHVSLWQKPEIRTAFKRAKAAHKTDATPTIKRRSVDERIAVLEETISILREQLRAYDELWALYEFNVHRMGLDPEELRRPLDRLNRRDVRSRRDNVRRW